MGNHAGPNGVPRWEALKEAIRLARHFVGTNYRWGGDDPAGGFDCSGLVVELLTSVSLMRRGDDMNAASMWEEFYDCQVSMAFAGCLVFYASNANQARITHVEFCISDFLAIGASGGGSKTLTVEDAIKQNAYIKVRPIRRDRAIVGFVDPFQRLAA